MFRFHPSEEWVLSYFFGQAIHIRPFFWRRMASLAALYQSLRLQNLACPELIFRLSSRVIVHSEIFSRLPVAGFLLIGKSYSFFEGKE
jgi:hypothetical protein